MISLDVVIDSTWGDITCPNTRAFWIEAIRKRFVVALLGGPPCETWSKAREHGIEEKRVAPRVLRLPALPWGLHSLSLRELRQLSAGNDLMGFMLEGIVKLFCTGGVAAMEHPAPPESQESVTIWCTPILQLLLRLPGCQLIQLSPTRFMGCEISEAHFSPCSQHTRHVSSFEKMANCQGLAEGLVHRLRPSWRLVYHSAKEYPLALNEDWPRVFPLPSGTAGLTLNYMCRNLSQMVCGYMICTAYGGHISPD